MNKKISELPELLATTDADMLEIVNAGVSKRVNVENLLAGASVGVTGMAISDITAQYITIPECITAFNALGLSYTKNQLYYVKPNNYSGMFQVTYSHEGATSEATHGTFYITKVYPAPQVLPNVDLVPTYIHLSSYSDKTIAMCDIHCDDHSIYPIHKGSLTFKVNGAASTIEQVNNIAHSPGNMYMQNVDVASGTDVITATYVPTPGSNLLAFTDFPVENRVY